MQGEDGEAAALLPAQQLLLRLLDPLLADEVRLLVAALAERRQLVGAHLPHVADEVARDGAERVASHGALAQRYVREYDRKWLRGGAPPDEPLVGSADIQSLADLGNSFEVLKEMKYVPFGLSTVFQLAVITLLPVLPLTLTMISLEELLERLIKMVF